MTALCIIGGIILFILILLYIPVTADMEYLNKKFTLRVKYLIFTVYSIPAAPKKKKKRKKRPEAKKRPKKKNQAKASVKDKKERKKPSVEKTEDDSFLSEEKKPDGEKTDGAEPLSDEDKELLEGKEEKRPEKEKKEPLSEKIDLLKEIIDKCLKYIIKIVKDIGIKKIRLDIVVGTPDACKTATDYGKISTAVWSAVGIMQSVMRKKFSAKHIRVSADFLSEETKIRASARVTITPAVVAGNLIVAGVKALAVLMKRKKQKQKTEKDSAAEKKAA